MQAVKNVSMESPYFEHHFPGMPVFPGVLTLEAMAQASGFFVMRSVDICEQRKVFAMLNASRSRWMQAVRPGDQIIIDAQYLGGDASHARTRTTATVAGKLVARAELSFALKAYNDEPEFAAAKAQMEMLRRVLENDPLIRL